MTQKERELFEILGTLIAEIASNPVIYSEYLKDGITVYWNTLKEIKQAEGTNDKA